MTGTTIAGSTDERFAEDWQAVRDNGAIQFEPVPPPEPRQPPDWLLAIGRWLNEALAGFIDLFGSAWPVVKIGLIAAGLVLLALLGRRLWQLYSDRQRASRSDPADDWQPDETEALALLEEADALAAAGRYGEAVHLLLERSVGQIRLARPDWLAPSTTSREIARLAALPDRARSAFAIIAAQVERALFARAELAERDWLDARGAYADFAAVGLPAG